MQFLQHGSSRLNATKRKQPMVPAASGLTQQCHAMQMRRWIPEVYRCSEAKGKGYFLADACPRETAASLHMEVEQDTHWPSICQEVYIKRAILDV